MAGPNKKERVAALHRESILSAAARMFAEKGFSSTTIEDISKKSQYSRRTIYAYFKNKEEIYNHIIYRHMNILKEAMEALMSERLSFSERYFRICRKLTELYEKYPMYFQSIMGNIQVSEDALLESEILRKIYAVGEEINDCMACIFRQGIDEGAVSPDIKILPAAYTLWSSIASLIVMANEKKLYILQRMNMSIDEFTDNGFKLLLRSLERRCSE